MTLCIFMGTKKLSMGGYILCVFAPFSLKLQLISPSWKLYFNTEIEKSTHMYKLIFEMRWFIKFYSYSMQCWCIRYLQKHTVVDVDHSSWLARHQIFAISLPAESHVTIVIKLVVSSSLAKPHVAVVIKAFRFRPIVIIVQQQVQFYWYQRTGYQGHPVSETHRSLVACVTNTGKRQSNNITAGLSCFSPYFWLQVLQSPFFLPDIHIGCLC